MKETRTHICVSVQWYAADHHSHNLGTSYRVPPFTHNLGTFTLAIEQEVQRSCPYMSIPATYIRRYIHSHKVLHEPIILTHVRTCKLGLL